MAVTPISSHYPTQVGGTPNSLLDNISQILVSANLVSPGNSSNIVLDIGNVAYTSGSLSVSASTFGVVDGDLTVSNSTLAGRVRPGDTFSLTVGSVTRTVTVYDVDQNTGQVTLSGESDLNTDSGTFSFAISNTSPEFTGDIYDSAGNVLISHTNSGSTKPVSYAEIDNANNAATEPASLEIWTGGSLPADPDANTIYITKA